MAAMLRSKIAAFVSQPRHSEPAVVNIYLNPRMKDCLSGTFCALMDIAQVGEDIGHNTVDTGSLVKDSMTQKMERAKLDLVKRHTEHTN